MLKAVLIDLDDTIYNHTYSLKYGLAAVLKKFECFKSYSLNEFVNEHLRLLDEIHREQVLTGKLSVKEAREERFRRVFNNRGYKSDSHLAAEAAEYYRINYEANRKLVNGAFELIRELRKKVKIGIVSNNLVSQQENKINLFGLDKYIDALVVSESAGYAKPDVRIFQTALNELNVSKDESVMIGDSWDEDIIGAYNSGIRAIWFNRKNLSIPDEMIAKELISFVPLEDALKLIFDGGLKFLKYYIDNI